MIEYFFSFEYYFRILKAKTKFSLKMDDGPFNTMSFVAVIVIVIAIVVVVKCRKCHQ